MKKSKTILKVLLVIVLLLLLGTSVQATDFGIYTQEDGCITKILPETTIADFKSNLSTEENVVIKNKEGQIAENSDIVKTGMTLEFGGTQYKLSVIGDTNGDGKITITDVVQCQLHVSNIKMLEGERAKSSDMNSDGKKSITDVVRLKLVQVKIKDIKEYVKEPSVGGTNQIYATLYNDGTLAFTATDKVIEGKTVLKKYGDIYEKEFYLCGPWKNEVEQITRVDIVDSIKPKYFERWFYGLTELEKIDNISNLDTSKVTDMNFLFSGCKKLTNLDLSSFDTSKVTNMNYMFLSCENLVSLNISSFNTSNVKEMKGMFEHCTNLTSLDLSNFDTSNVTHITSMFGYCEKLTTIDLSNFDTNNVINMDYMFMHSGLTNIDVGANWNTDNKSIVAMFSDCPATYLIRTEENAKIYVKLYNDGTLAFTATDKKIAGKTVVKEYGDIGKKEFTRSIPWEEEKAQITQINIVDAIAPRIIKYWFKGLTNLQGIDNISNLNTSKVTNMSYMFDGCKNLTNLDFSSFDTSNVSNMQNMFSGCESLVNLNLGGLNTNKVITMYNMFGGCESLTSLNLNSFDTSNVSNMQNMFANCKSLTSLDLSGFNTENVTSMKKMFSNCRRLTNLNLSNFDTSKVTDMSDMFGGLFGNSLTSLDLSSFDTSNVTNMSAMFANCELLTNLNISRFDTSKVTDMNNMFCNCKALTSLDLSSFDTSKVRDMNNMFESCTELINIYVSSNWNTDKASVEDMFKNCKIQSVTERNAAKASLSESVNKLKMFAEKFV